MADKTSTDHQSTLSKRAQANVDAGDPMDGLMKSSSNPWSPQNLSGTVLLGLAESVLMGAEMENHIRTNFTVDPPAHFMYSAGPQGSPRLRRALSGFFNHRFSPLGATHPDEFIVTAGVTALIDHITWCLCDDGDGLLIHRPLYTSFLNDMQTRSRGKVIPVSFAEDGKEMSLDAVFEPEANAKFLERALRRSEEAGVRVRGVIVCNPHNPLGKCFPVETMVAIARFCATHNLHYISDEIYAMSVFANPDFANATAFHSILSINLTGVIDPDLMHVLYGASKDFCANGLRIGTLHSRNKTLRQAMTSITTFGWGAYLLQDMWARILEDTSFLDVFIAENHNRLAKHYTLLTAFFRTHNIPFYRGGNAGFFVWFDVRHLFVPDPHKDFTVLRAGSPEYARMAEKEHRLVQCWLSAGVLVSRGSAFLSEEVGWFRIVFTSTEEGLRLGLERLVEGLRAFERGEGSLRDA